MKETELKPCPFCGGEAVIDVHSFYNEKTKGFTDHNYGVICQNCNAQTAQFYLTKAQAKGAWNARAASARLEKEICDFSEMFLGVSLSDVPDEAWEEFKKGISLLEALVKYKEGADNEQREA